MRLLWLALFLAFATIARAADGDGCSLDTHYSPGSYACVQLADARIATGTISNSTPYDTTIATGGRSLKTVFAIGRCPASCEPAVNINLCESDSAVVGAPNVCHVVGTLTGCGASPLVSEIVTRRLTKRWVWVEFSADVTDADCSAPGFDATLTFLP